MIWKDLGKMIEGTPPAPSKDSKAFTSLGGKLFRFGGLGYQGYNSNVCFEMSIEWGPFDFENCFRQV
jgi:hypothetical protein